MKFQVEHEKVKLFKYQVISKILLGGVSVEADGIPVSALDSRLSDVGSSPGWGHCALCSWSGHLTLTVPLLTQVYKWALAN